MTDVFRYEARDLITGQLLALDLPLGGVSYSDKLKQAGTLTGWIDLGENALDWLAATTPRRTALWVYLNGHVDWGGIIWARGRAGKDRKLPITAQSFWSYFDHRRLYEAKAYTGVADAGVDQLTIAQDLVNWAQAVPNGNINIDVGTETSGVLRLRKPLAWGYELKKISELIQTEAELEDGYDFGITYGEVNDLPVATFRTWYPRRGRRWQDSGVSFTLGKNLIDYDAPEDGLDAATNMFGIGAGDGADMVLVESFRTDILDAGYPRQDSSITRKNIADADQLRGYTNAEVDARAETPMTWKLIVDPDDPDLPYGSWTLGDDAKVIIPDDYGFPAGVNGEPGFEAPLRIIGQTVTPDDDGGTTGVVLEMGDPVG